MTAGPATAKRRHPLRRLFADWSGAVKRARGDLATPWRRFLGQVETLFIDHAIFRLLYANRFPVSERLWRSSQPTAGQIARLAERGIRTIVNLRGKRDCASYLIEAEACRRHGVALVDFPVNSRELPSAAKLHACRDMLAAIEYPALIHCKVGSDRAGLMAALYLLITENRPVEEAQKQLSLRFGHVRQSKAGVLDRFFEEFKDHRARVGGDFFAWIDGPYDPAAIRAAHRSRGWADFLYDRILRRE